MRDLRLCLLLSLLLPPLTGCRGEEAPSGHAAQAPAPSASQPFPASFPGRDPNLRWDASGNLHLVYVEDRPGGPAVLYRRLGADAAGPFTVSPAGMAVVADTESPPTLEILPDGALVTGYPVALPGKWKSEIRVQRSADHGRTWSEPRLLHPRRDGSYSFLSSTVTPAGTVAFAWLDNRAGHMGVYAASTRDGQVFSPNQTVDAETCQCCGTALLAGRGGEIWLAYRDLEPGNLRDFRVLRSPADPLELGDGVKLSEDGWRVNGCPETGARLAQAPDGTLWAAWFTAGGEAGVYATSSPDAGASFAPRALVSETGRPARHPEIGVLPDGRIAVLYETVASDGSHPIVIRIRDRQGGWSAPRTVTDGGSYPRFAGDSTRTALAFTRRSGERTSVEVIELTPPPPAPGASAPGPSRGEREGPRRS
ncbi:MAG TPA: sialidase family protein [Thermoanaerobaculia bacterium]|nr:sialidase family protein [Thermoanaerobaculia bacterium]